MSQKMNYREIEMDVLEQLYYQRKEKRLKSFARRRKGAAYKKNPAKQGSNIFDGSQKQSICNMC